MSENQNSDNIANQINLPENITKEHREGIFAALMQNNPVAIVVIDLDGTVQTCNPAFEDLFGYSFSEMSGKHIDLFITIPDMYQEALEYTERVTHGEIVRITSRRWRRDGTPVDVESQGVPIFVAGKQRGVLTLYHDITHLTKAESLQREMYESFVRMMDSLDADIYVSDLNTHEIYFVNKHMKESFGNNLVGQICYKLFRNLDSPCEHCTNQILLNDKGEPNPTIVWEGFNPITRKWYKNSDCAIRWSENGYSRLQIATDITEIKNSEQRMLELATHDPLTGLPNRVLLQDRLNHALAHAKRSGSSLAVLFADLDRFKEINDNFGHHIGDKVLIEIARRMQRCIRENDTLARVSGDEFVFVLENIKPYNWMDDIANRIIKTVNQPIDFNHPPVQISVSLGMSFFPQDGYDEDSLLKRADAAMYEVKKMGGNGFYAFPSTGVPSK
jgi:diguanylate cyclase (GGDEF)-like protein/PAS domain S-box-containing protein